MRKSTGRRLSGVAVEAPFGLVKLYFDPATHLLAAARYRICGPQGASDAEQRWSDYRTVEGRAICVLIGGVSRRNEIHGIHGSAGAAKSQGRRGAFLEAARRRRARKVTAFSRSITLPSESLCRCSCGRGCIDARRRLAPAGTSWLITGLIFPARVQAERFRPFQPRSKRAAGLQSAEIHADHGDVPAHQLQRMKARRLRAGP